MLKTIILAALAFALLAPLAMRTVPQDGSDPMPVCRKKGNCLPLQVR